MDVNKCRGLGWGRVRQRVLYAFKFRANQRYGMSEAGDFFVDLGGGKPMHGYGAAVLIPDKRRSDGDSSTYSCAVQGVHYSSSPNRS